MEEKCIDHSTISNKENFILKILFGPMFGCELCLPADDYFFSIHPGIKQHNICESLQEEIFNTASFACNTLYIPCDVDSPNVALHLAKKVEIDGSFGYQIDILNPEGSHSEFIKENVIFQHKSIRLAIKKHDNQWAEEILTCDWSRINQLSSLSERSAKKINLIRHRFFSYYSFSLVLIFIIICVAIYWYKYPQQSNNLISLNMVLANSPAPLKIIKSDNNKIYVFGDGYQEIAWLHEVLYKLNEIKKVTPVWTQKKQKEVIKYLHNKGFPALHLDLTFPEFPQLYTYQKLNNEQEISLKKQAHHALPYARRIDIFFKDKEILVKQAQHGLERIQVPYHRIATETGYALIVRDALSDNAINALDNFISDFYHQWGDQVVNFSINLNENILQDKSYLDTPDGYLFIAPQHWYFPPNERDIHYG